MATIKTILDTRRAKSDGTYPFKLRVFLDTKYQDVSLSIFLKTEDWDFHAWFSQHRAPFFAGTKVPSMKYSDRSKPTCWRKSLGKVSKMMEKRRFEPIFGRFDGRFDTAGIAPADLASGHRFGESSEYRPKLHEVLWPFNCGHRHALEQI